MRYCGICLGIALLALVQFLSSFTSFRTHASNPPASYDPTSLDGIVGYWASEGPLGPGDGPITLIAGQNGIESEAAAKTDNKLGDKVFWDSGCQSSETLTIVTWVRLASGERSHECYYALGSSSLLPKRGSHPSPPADGTVCRHFIRFSGKTWLDVGVVAQGHVYAARFWPMYKIFDLSDGRWHMLAAVIPFGDFPNVKVKCYVDGEFVGAAYRSRSDAPEGDPCTEDSKGLLVDRVGIYRRALSPKEMLGMYVHTLSDARFSVDRPLR